jgi:two-component system cell cycle response regulator DivK
MARILVVEDSPDNRDLLVRIFQRFGHETLACANGAEGVALARQQLPDAIVMDLMMPKVDGWEAVRRLKADARTAHIPVLVVTANALRDAEQRARAVGCDAFLPKPFRVTALLAALDSLLARSSEVGGDK